MEKVPPLRAVIQEELLASPISIESKSRLFLAS